MGNDTDTSYILDPASPMTKYNETILQSHHQDIDTICILNRGCPQPAL